MAVLQRCGKGGLQQRREGGSTVQEGSARDYPDGVQIDHRDVDIWRLARLSRAGHIMISPAAVQGRQGTALLPWVLEGGSHAAAEPQRPRTQLANLTTP